MQQEPLLGEKA